MVLKDRILQVTRLLLILILIFGGYGATPAQASAQFDRSLSDQEMLKSNEKPELLSISSSPQNNIASSGEDCDPDKGSMWVNGPLQPEVAAQAQDELSQMGIHVTVEARSYGEIDGCETYTHRGVDFTITLSDSVTTNRVSEQSTADQILTVLTELAEPALGNVKFISASGELLLLDNALEAPMTTSALDAESLPADAITKKVYVIAYDPLLSSGQTLSQYMHWNDHATITQQTIDFFKQASANKLNYTVVDTTVVHSGWPELIDGFSYNESTFMATWVNPATHHTPTQVNYNKIVNSPEFDICGKVNRGEIDEVWIYNGPWFGFYKSTLVGPGGYWFNSSPVSGTHTCNKLVPIMGPSVERTVGEATENFGHRTESTMRKVYGSWSQNNTSHNWNRFGLVKAQSPSYSYSGCGSVHYPANATTDYDWSNSSNVALSNCADFANYPNLSDPLQVAQPTTCSTWGCTALGHFNYWFSHFPSVTGCGTDNVANDWWKYIANPAYAVHPSYVCQSDTRLISGNAGIGNAILSYEDGGAKTATVDTYGNYFLMVSNHWSGAVTISRAGYTFTPVSKNYLDVQTDQYNQDYTSTITMYTVSGNTTLGGVTLSYTNGTPLTVTSDSNGNYSFFVPYNWSGTVTPSKTGFTFSPSSRSYSAMQADKTAQDYIPVVTISGNTSRSGVTLNYTDGTAKTATSDSNGNYSLAVSYNWTGTITPVLAGYTFTPSSRGYTNLITDQPTQNFTATGITSTISGNAGVGGTTIGYTDGTAKTTIADQNGDYTFTVSYSWSGTVIPSKPGYLFTPYSKTYSSVVADQLAQNYTTATGIIISGNAGTGGTTLSYYDTTTKTVASDSSGNYVLTVPINWSGTVTPSKASYIFTPANRSYTSLQTDQNTQDYTATALYTISGNTGVGSVTLSYVEGSMPKSVTSNSSGAYSFTVTEGWFGVVTPSKTGLVFEPVSISYSNVQANQAEQNYRSIVMVTSNADSGTGSLRQVIANALAGSTIRFDPSLAGQTITLVSTISASKNLTIDGSTLNPRIEISGNNSVRIFSLGSTTTTIELRSLILKNGYVSGSDSGSALNIGGGTISIRDVRFIGNTAYQGGAINGSLYNINLVITDSEFISNTARDSGGAIYMRYSPVTVKNSSFVQNTATGTGGAITTDQSSLQAEYNTFTSNSASSGGVICFTALYSQSLLRGNLFSQNAAGMNGGVVHVLYIHGSGTLKIENNTFYSNQANNGGALSLKQTSTIQNNTFYANRATVSGTSPSSILFTAPFTTTLNNNIFAQGINGVDCSISGTGTQSLTGTNNLMDNGTSPCIDIPNSIGSDVFLDAPADNGGPTWTMGMPSDSPVGMRATMHPAPPPINAEWRVHRAVTVTLAPTNIKPTQQR
ncbi:MAG: hypothetical protein QM730_12330 [Anaerolineales bacterium]